MGNRGIFLLKPMKICWKNFKIFFKLNSFPKVLYVKNSFALFCWTYFCFWDKVIIYLGIL